MLFTFLKLQFDVEKVRKNEQEMEVALPIPKHILISENW